MRKFKILVGLGLILSLALIIPLSKTGYADEGTRQSTTHEGDPSGQSQPAPTVEAVSKEGNLILLRAGTIDTSESPSLDKAGIEAGLNLMGLESGDAAYYLVQFHGPIQEEWKADIQSAGGKLFGFVPNHTLIVKMRGAMAEEVTALPEVKWVGLYRPTHKIAPDLSAEAQAASEPLTVTIMTFELTAVEGVVAAVEKLGGQALDWQPASRRSLIRAEIDPATAAEIARLVEVSWIEPFVAPELTNDVARGAELMNVDVVHEAHGLTGAGQIIGHADTGLDVGDLTELHPDLRGRVKAAFAWGRRALSRFASPGSCPMGLAWDGTYFWNISR